MAKKSFYCPHCFNLIKNSELIFQSINCGATLKRTPSFFEKIGVTTPPKSIPCTQELKEKAGDSCKSCSKKLTQRICPECQGVLPYVIDDLSDITIAIIGAIGAGKSHFIALLIQRIIQLYKTFDWTLQALTEDTITTYKNNFYKPLFKDEITLEATKANETQKPLMYSLKFKKTRKRIMLVFFDAAGEHFNSEQSMHTLNRYIYNASGIICLMDPLQLPPIRKEVESLGIKLPEMKKGTEKTGTEEILNRLNNIIRIGYSQKEKDLKDKNIPIPLAIAFSKIDTLKTTDPNYTGRLLFDQESVIYQDSRYHGYLDKKELETINTLLHSWLTEANQTGILNQCGDFSKHKFFGVSALGAPPQQNNSLSCPPRPLRVEDPFLWILAENGFISTK